MVSEVVKRTGLTREQIEARMATLSPAKALEVERLLSLLPPSPPSFADYAQSTFSFRLHAWQVQLCNRLSKLKNQTGQRLMIHKPPQHGGSVLIQRLIAYLIGCEPEMRVALACYNITHAAGFGEMVRSLMQEPEFVQQFGPGAALDRSDPSSEKFRTVARAKMMDAQYSFMALGLLSGFTGKGADFLAVDDPYASDDDARSEAINERVWRWWTRTAGVRINDETNVVVMFHRYHEDDFAGRLLAQGGWEYWRFPAVMDENEDGSDRTGRAVGEVLSPIRSREFLQSIEDKEPQVYIGQFQGRPRPPEGAFFHRDWLKVIPVGEIPRVGKWVRFWDLATKADARGDFTAGALVGLGPDQTVYVRDVVRFRAEWPEACATIVNVTEQDRHLCEHLGASYAVGVEKVAWQRSMIADLFTTAVFQRVQLEPVPPDGDKKERASGWAAKARHDKLRLAANSQWNQEFITEAVCFDGYGLTHDDQIDAVSGAYKLVWMLQGMKPDEQVSPIENTSARYFERLSELADEQLELDQAAF